MNDKEARLLSIDLMEIAKTAILTTIDSNGFPHTRALFNLRHKKQFYSLHRLFEDNANNFTVYFTTNTSSSKINHIKTNPKVSVYYCKPSEFRGLMLGGTIKIVTDRNEKETIWQEGWEMYYPKGAHDPDHTLLKFKPSYARYYHQLDALEFNPSGKAQ
jgi:general stress protein 26